MVYRRLSSIMFPVLAVLLTGALFWGYQEHQEKNSILIKAENQYQRAFHDLAFHVDKLHEQLGNTLAVNSTSKDFHRKGLVNVWRLTSQAQNEISQLPLSFLPFTEAENFLSHISNFAYKTAVRDLSSQPLTEGEFKTLKALYDKSGEIVQDLNRMQQDVIASNLRWMDVEVAIAADQANSGNLIVDGLRSMDKKVSAYPELDWGPSVSSMYERRSIKLLSGEPVTADTIKTKAASFLGMDASGIQVGENGKDTEYASYSAQTESNGSLIQLEYTAKGGQLLSYRNGREIGQSTVDFQKARIAADQFLDSHDFKGMKPVSYDQYGDSGSFTYVATQNGVLIYPEKLTVKVALDKGEVVAMQANDYVYEHRKREMPSPIMSKEQARKSLNPEMKVSGEELALIKNEMGEEVLCHEFTGGINGYLYKIYINADTGYEEAIEPISPEDKKAAA
ncbi:germination protein YpeB [Paenibacillus oryzae]|uniref:Germination protein YpeB n=1 Tax=Paenibacillus oryzae TaxID=1844972 RepID=A0A1A5YGZ3_9BACL|nr:germination protein YpeB [Paenibacillus oryzae]OBR64854.1 germination protein YpeB [Paenibacillus oryzae]